MAEVFTSGTWAVKDGSEDAFIAAWTEFADWTKANMPGAQWALLLRDREVRNRFVSIGPWGSEEQIAAWRDSEGFRERIGRVRGLLDRFEPASLDRVAGVD